MNDTFWGILELMGHAKVAGRITEETRFGAVVGRCDIPQKDGSFITQFFGGGSIYRLTICSEEMARHHAIAEPPAELGYWNPKVPRALPAAEEVEGEDETF